MASFVTLKDFEELRVTLSSVTRRLTSLEADRETNLGMATEDRILRSIKEFRDETNVKIQQLHDTVATKQELGALANRLATKQELGALANRLATKQELGALENRLATKQELGALENRLATKQELGALANRLATKQELGALENRLATKQELGALENRLSSSVAQMDQKLDKLLAKVGVIS